MSRKEAPRPGLIRAALEGKITNEEAARCLGISARQVRRLKRRYRREGLEGLLHKGRGRRSSRRLPAAQRRRVMELMKKVYAGLNDCHLTEKLREKEGLMLCRETVRRLRREAGLAPQRPRRPARYFRRRLREAQSGRLVLVDGSPFPWLGEKHPPFCAIAAQDDATGALLGLSFRPEEDLHGYATTLQQVFDRYGLPVTVYGDRTNILVRNDAYWSLEEQLQGYQDPTQMGSVLKDLGIKYIAAQTPQAKGRVERMWGTLQGRLPAELRLAGIKTMEEANDFASIFIEDFNSRFARAPREGLSAWRRPPTDLRHRIGCRYWRTVSHDWTVTLQERQIQLPCSKNRHPGPGSRVELREILDGRLLVFFKDRLVISAKGPCHGFVLRPRKRASKKKAPSVAKTLAPAKPGGAKHRAQSSPPGPEHPWRRFVLHPPSDE